MRFCAHCFGRLGVFPTHRGALKFCDQVCGDTYVKEQQQSIRVMQFLSWLNQGRNRAWSVLTQQPP